MFLLWNREKLADSTTPPLSISLTLQQKGPQKVHKAAAIHECLRRHECLDAPLRSGATLNHYALKPKLYVAALHSTFEQLQTMQPFCSASLEAPA